MTTPQLFFANTKDLPKDGFHYHVNRRCTALAHVVLHEKRMCLHCLDAQKMRMLVLRLEIMRPYAEQQMAQGIYGTPDASMILFGGQTGFA